MNKIILDNDISRVKEQFVINSRIIADRFEKDHSKVMIKIKEIIEGISENGDTQEKYFIDSSYILEQNNQEYKEYLITEIGFSLLVMGFTGEKAFKFKLDYINLFEKMKNALLDIQFKVGDKKHQIECMAMLHTLLPEEFKKDKIVYVKANTVVNKVTSDYFGLPKMINKADMNNEMLQVRERVLDDYVKLYDVFESNTMVSEALKAKYRQLMIKYEDTND